MSKTDDKPKKKVVAGKRKAPQRHKAKTKSARASPKKATVRSEVPESGGLVVQESYSAPQSIDEVPVTFPPPPAVVMDWKDLSVALAIIWIGTFAVSLVTGVGAIISNTINYANSLPFESHLAMLVKVWFFGNIFAVIVAWYFACHRTGASLSLGLGIQKVPWGNVWGGAIIGVLLALGWLAIVAGYRSFHSTASGAAVLLQHENAPIYFALAVVAPPFEEIYFRGFLYTTLSRLISPIATVAVVSLWFTLDHGSMLAWHWFGLVWIGIVATALTLLRNRFNSILPSLACHWSYNCTLAVIWTFKMISTS